MRICNNTRFRGNLEKLLQTTFGWIVISPMAVFLGFVAVYWLIPTVVLVGTFVFVGPEPANAMGEGLLSGWRWFFNLPNGVFFRLPIALGWTIGVVTETVWHMQYLAESRKHLERGY